MDQGLWMMEIVKMKRTAKAQLIVSDHLKERAMD
jgi:hypothetical protein